MSLEKVNSNLEEWSKAIEGRRLRIDGNKKKYIRYDFWRKEIWNEEGKESNKVECG